MSSVQELRLLLCFWLSMTLASWVWNIRKILTNIEKTLNKATVCISNDSSSLQWHWCDLLHSRHSNSINQMKWFVLTVTLLTLFVIFLSAFYCQFSLFLGDLFLVEGYPRPLEANFLVTQERHNVSTKTFNSVHSIFRPIYAKL